jgi:type I restriction enzyme, R subunit
MSQHSEAFARVLIDKALTDSNWDILDSLQVEFEYNNASGRADYLLKDRNGRVLCVLEAKREDKDPYDAKEQGRGYAENLNAPFVILSNGKEHWFWNYERRDEADAYRIEALPSREDLERQRLKNLQPPRPLLTEKVDANYIRRFRDDIQLHGYQVNALNEIARQFDNEKRRKFLLEMATGTGKTLLCAALIRRFLETRNAERVLFIVDRIELAKQTMEDFNVILREYSPVIYKNARRTGELLGSSVVVATIQSLMVDRRYREEFTPFYFDLVVNDEAHRSIYGDAREVVQFFQGTRIGLTATPKAYLRNIDIDKLGAENPKALEARFLRDTYHYFGCEPGNPTFRYDIIDAVKDPEGPFLCRPKIIDIRSDITTQALEDTGWAVTINEEEESYKVQDLERKIFTPARNELMCRAFLENAQKAPDGNLGKSIIFAVNQRHATELTKILNGLQPESAITITSRIPESSVLAKDFRDGNRKEPIAVSVDMLSTGYNCRPLLNVVLMRPIFSPTEYIQIKGRGTRRYTFKDGNTEYEKEFFFLLDFCGVAEYFEEKYDYTIPLELPKNTKARSGSAGAGTRHQVADETSNYEGEDAGRAGKPEIPVWQGKDTVVSKEIYVVGPDGEKVDVMTYRGAFERDLKDFAQKMPDFQQAVESEDDDMVEVILNERFFHKPEWYYSADKLVKTYGVPAPTPSFIYHALGKRRLPSKEQVVDDTVDSLAARFNLRYSEQKWLQALARLIVDDPEARQQFLEDNPEIFARAQFRQLGDIQQLRRFTSREQVFEALRQSSIIRRSISGALSI